MAYSQAIVQRAMQRLQSENEQNEQSSRARIAAIYEKEPRLGEIERELRRTAAHVLAATFRRQGDPVAAMQQLRKDNLALQQERDWILQAEGLEPDDLTVQPICPTCGGTGYVGAAMCECLKELCRQEQKKELTNLFGAESFEKFRLDLYSDQYDAKYRSSPRELMRATYRMTQNYAQSFPADGQPLVFSGATGLGKTFLSACVAQELHQRLAERRVQDRGQKHVHVHGPVRAAGGGAVAWPGAAARGADPPQKRVPHLLFKPHDGPHCVHHPHLAGAVPL